MAGTLADLIEQRFGLETEDGRDMPADAPGTEMLARVLARRVHRRFDGRPVPDEVLRVLLATAFSASAKSDLQQAGVILIKDRAKQETIASWIEDMPWIAKAPAFMVWVGDNRRIRRVCELRGIPFGNDNIDSFMNAAVDTALVMQTFMLAAESQGLGCCPISVVRNHIEKLGELLELPDWVFPVAGLCVGYPAQPGYVSLRVPQALTVHVDRYDDSNLEAEIDAYDRRRDARFSIPKSSQRHVDRYGEAAFYGWSEDKARQTSLPERDRFRAWLQAHGFSLA